MLPLAHGGLGLREDLPIPSWLFAYAAVIVLVASFIGLAALWPKPKLERSVDGGWRPLPGGFGAFLGSRGVELACGAIGALLLPIVIVAGYVGPEVADSNLLPTFVCVIFWVGLVFVSVLFGDVYRAFNPWRAIGRLFEHVADRTERPRPYPEKFGRYPAAIGLLGFTWNELAYGGCTLPGQLATACVVYTVVTFFGMWRYGVEPWCENGEAFSVYFGFFARVSAVETRNRIVGLRAPLYGLTRLDPVQGTVAVVCVMIGTVTFDGFEQGALYRSASNTVNDWWMSLGFSDINAPRITATIGIAIGVAVITAFYRLGIDGARSVGGSLNADRLRIRFIHTLVPIAVVYAAAHYLTLLVFGGQRILYLASDPFGQGWNLFGTATDAINYGIFSQTAAWYFQVGFVVCGHVAGLILAHDRALILYKRPRQAVRSQYWMLGIMVGFTTLALWLLAQSGT